MRQQGLILLIYYAKKSCFPGAKDGKYTPPTKLPREHLEGTQTALSHALGDAFRRQVASQGIMILVNLGCYFENLNMRWENCTVSSTLGHNCVEKFSAVAAQRWVSSECEQRAYLLQGPSCPYHSFLMP